MMKKLVLMLMLVLGMASLASALPVGVELSVNGQTDGAGNITEVRIETCNTLIIDVYGPADEDYSAWVGIMGAFPNITGGEWGDQLGEPYLPMCSSYYYEADLYPITYPAAGDDLAGVQRLEYADWGYGYMVTASSATSVPGGKQFDLLFHCCSEGDVTIEIYDMGDWSVADTIVVHQIPEPMTITLLGLGGLLLRRRK